MILMIYTVLALCCVVIPPVPIKAIICGAACIACTGIPLLAGAILAAIRRNSDMGALCASNKTVVYSDEDGTEITFEDVGASLSTLFIIQFIFICPMLCCAMAGSQLGIA